MSDFDAHAYKMAILNDMKDCVDDGLKEGDIDLTDAHVVVALLKEAVRMPMTPPEVRTVANQMAQAYPIFKAIPLYPSYLNDENATADKLYKDMVDRLLPSTGKAREPHSQASESKEFTRKFSEPITVKANDSGIWLLYNRGTMNAMELQIDLRSQGWELDEPIEAHDLLKSDRVRVTERSRKYWTGDAVTVRFRR